MMVREFNGSKSITLGEVDQTLEIEPCQFEVPFIVINILATFNMLLTRLWIHTAGQKVKFTKEDRLIHTMGEKEIRIHLSSVIPFIDMQEVREDSQCHAFEYISVNFIYKRTPVPRSSSGTNGGSA